MRIQLTIIALLACALLPLALREDGGGGGDGDAPPSVAEVARRVEQIRGLRFTRLPAPLEVTAREAQREALAVLDRDYPPARRALDEDLYEQLGLLEPGSDMREIFAAVYGGAVGGYYDPEDGRLRVVTGGGTANDVIAQVTLAHELDHALEDQAIGFDTDDANATDDPGIAYKSLIEGSATALMFTYLERHFPTDVALAGLFGSAGSAGATGDLPPFISASLNFPYETGLEFVRALYRRGDGSWRLVDQALRRRPPVSTEQVLHPAKWFAREAPEPVRAPRAPAGWERAGAGTLGEFQIEQWLRTAGPPAADAAAGWGGDRYAVHRRGEERLLLLRFVWDTAADRREFVGRLPGALAERGSGAAAFAVRAGAVTVAYAPDRALARRLARGAPG